MSTNESIICAWDSLRVDSLWHFVEQKGTISEIIGGFTFLNVM